MYRLFLLLVHILEAQDLTCHGSAQCGTSDAWCNANCNHVPPNCPFWLCECEGPGPTPPPPPPTPPARQIGYYEKTWLPVTGAPAGATFGVAFSGWADYKLALRDSTNVSASLVGEKYLSLGGGNDNGGFDSSNLAEAAAAIRAGELDAWDGLVLDIEICHQTGLASSFSSVLAAAKAMSMKTLVTVSHSAPYACHDDMTLMPALVQDGNVDYLSPQLYTNGAEQCPDFALGAGVPWSTWKAARGALVPSIVDGTQYDMVHLYFSRTQGLESVGYVQWAAPTSDGSVLI